MTGLLFAVLLILAAFLLDRQVFLTGPGAITAEHRPETRVVHPGETFLLSVTVTNRSRIPRFFVRIEERLPEGILPAEEHLPLKKGMSREICVQYTFAVRAGETKTLSIPVKTDHRGRFVLRPLHVKTGDLLGLREAEAVFDPFRELVSAPALSGEDAASPLPGGFLGQLSVRRWLFPDPVLSAGLREYTGREPMKTIAFRQSARAGALMVRTPDHTAEPAVMVALLTAVTGACSGPEACFEQALSLCADVVHFLTRKQIPFSLRTDAALAGEYVSSDGVEEGLGEAHLLRAEECLGRALMPPVRTPEELFRNLSGRQTQSVGVLLILADPAMRTHPAVGAIAGRTAGPVQVLCPAEKQRVP